MTDATSRNPIEEEYDDDQPAAWRPFWLRGILLYSALLGHLSRPDELHPSDTLLQLVLVIVVAYQLWLGRATLGRTADRLLWLWGALWLLTPLWLVLFDTHIGALTSANAIVTLALYLILRHAEDVPAVLIGSAVYVVLAFALVTTIRSGAPSEWIGVCHVAGPLRAAGCTHSRRTFGASVPLSLPHPRRGVAHLVYTSGSELVSIPVNRWHALVGLRTRRMPMFSADWLEATAGGAQIVAYSTRTNFQAGEIHRLAAALFDWPSLRLRSDVAVDEPAIDEDNYDQYRQFWRARDAERAAWRAAQDADRSAIVDLKYAADLSRLVVVRNDGRVQAWHDALPNAAARSTLPPLTVNPTLDLPPQPPDWTLWVSDARDAVISNDGTRVAVRTADALLLYAPPQPLPIATLPRGSQRPAFSPDGTRLAHVVPVVDDVKSNGLLIYDADGAPVATIERMPLLFGVPRFASDGRTLIVPAGTYEFSRWQALLFFDATRWAR